MATTIRRAGSLVALSLLAACGKPSGKAPAPAVGSGAAPVVAPAAKVAEVEQPYTIALVYSGWEIWIGNDQVSAIAEDDPSRTLGMLNAIRDAVAQADFAHKAPSGSQVAVVTYADKVQLRVPLGPIASFTPAALGVQKDYYNAKGLELVRGVSAAIDELEKSSTPIKRVILLSDGNDTNNEAAKPQLAQLKQRAAALHIDIASLVYKTMLSNADDITTKLTDTATVDHSAGELTADLLHAFQHAGHSACKR